MSRAKLRISKIFSLLTLMFFSIKAKDFNVNRTVNEQIFKKFLQQIDNEQSFKISVVFGKSIDEFNVETVLQKDLEKEVFVFSNIKNLTAFCDYCTHFLAIVHWQEESSKQLLEVLAEILNFKRSNRIVVIKNDFERNFSLKNIHKFFLLSDSLKLINLVLIFKDFSETNSIYQSAIYPELAVRKMSWRKKSFEIFPNKLQNLYGSAIRTIPDQVLPKTAAIIDDQGQLQVKGYVMQFLNLFSKYINATLQFPLNVTIGKILNYSDILNLTQQNLVDVPASLSSCYTPGCLQTMSYIYEVNKWCVMVPIEHPYCYKDYLKLNVNRSFFRFVLIGKFGFSILLVLSRKLWSLNHKVDYSLSINSILLNLNIFAGILGCPFKLEPNPSMSMRFIYFFVSVFGLMHYVLASVILQTFLSYPYSYRIETMEDLTSSNLRVLITQSQFDYIKDYLELSHKNALSIFKPVSDYEEFYQIQLALNTSYAYPIPSPLWFMYDALQMYINKPIFRLTSLCFPYMTTMGFVLPPDSLFMEPLNRLIIRVRDMGLLERWLKTSYIDLVKIKKIYIPKDLSVVKKSYKLQFEDFAYVGNILLKAFVVAFVVFIGEIFWYRLWHTKNA